MKAKPLAAIGCGVLAIVAVFFARGDAPTTAQRSRGSAAAVVEKPAAPSSARTHAPAFPTVAIAAGALRLEGQAIDDQERPVAGATITLAGSRETITEADGSFSFDGLADGSYSLTGELGEMYGEAANESLYETSDPIMLTMRHGPMLVVKVVGAKTKQPVADANVRESRHERVTGADGVAMIRGLEIGSTWFEVHAKGYAPQSFRVELGDKPAVTVERVVQLATASTVEGTVVDEDGRPVPKAQVKVEAPGDVWNESVECDDAGRFRFDALSAGKHVFRASSDLHLEAGDHVVELDGATPKTGVVVRVQLGGEVAGVVVDAHGRPVKDARVRVAWNRATTDETGAFLVQGLEPGTHDATAETETGGSTPVPVIVEKARRTRTRLVLAQSSIAGVVRDVHGVGVEDAFVTLKEKTTEKHAFAHTDENGRFDTGGLPPGVYEVSVERKNEPSHESQVLATVKSPVRNLALVIPDSIRIVGRVILEGKPVTRFGVAITDDAKHAGSPDVITARDGKFERDDVTAGSWFVVIAGEDFTKKTVDVVVTAGTVDLGDIVVERGRSLAGRVVDDRGAPIAGALVVIARNSTWRGDESLWGATRGNRSARTDAAGHYRIYGLETADGQRIQATTATGMSKEVLLPVDATTLDFVVTSAGSITGHIDHMATRQTLVRATSLANRDEDYSAFVDASGGFVIERLPAGEYEVSVSGENTLRPLRVTVRSGEATPMVFEMPEHPITLRVRSKGCHLITLEDPDKVSRGLEICENDVATFKAVAPGHYRVCTSECTDIELQDGIAQQEFEAAPDP